MSGPTNTRKARIEQGIARGWDDERIAREVGVSVDAVIAGRAWLEDLVCEDGPIKRARTPTELRQKAAREVLERAERRRLARQHYLDELERERRIVLTNARISREPERVGQRRARNAAWMRLYRARKAAA